MKRCARVDSEAGSPIEKSARLGAPIWKRFVDVCLIVVTAPAWLMMMLVISAGIKFLSPGPVLYRQERVGFRGGRFLCLKFRTMHTGANTMTHEKLMADLIRSNRPMTKLDARDSRLIPLAWMLRSSGLDELPQLFNVLRGEMSLVGPRPCTPSEYDACSTAQRARSDTLPGLTGLWQVSGKNRTTFNEMIELDLRYVRTRTLRLDLVILLRTHQVLLVQMTQTLGTRKVNGPSSADMLPAQARMRAIFGTCFTRATDRTISVAVPQGRSPSNPH